MSHSLQKYISDKTNDILYPIIPRNPHLYFNVYASLPSARYRNIVYFYYQCYGAENANNKFILSSTNDRNKHKPMFIPGKGIFPEKNVVHKHFLYLLKTNTTAN